MSTLEHFAIAVAVIAIVGAVLYVMWPAKVAAVVTRVESYAAPVAQVITPTPVDPVEQLFSAMNALEQIGKRQGIATLAQQFAGVHSANHTSFVQAALAAPKPAEQAVPKAPAPSADPLAG